MGHKPPSLRVPRDPTVGGETQGSWGVPWAPRWQHLSHGDPEHPQPS